MVTSFLPCLFALSLFAKLFSGKSQNFPEISSSKTTRPPTRFRKLPQNSDVAFQMPFKRVDGYQIFTAKIDRRKVQVHGQLDVGCRHFRWLLRRVFRFVAKVHARCRSTYATLRRNRPSPSYTGAANRHQSNCSYELIQRLESFPKFCKSHTDQQSFQIFRKSVLQTVI